MFHPDNDLKLKLARQYMEERFREAAVYRMLKQRNTKGRFQMQPAFNQVANIMIQIMGTILRQPKWASYPGAMRVNCEECTA